MKWSLSFAACCAPASGDPPSRPSPPDPQIIRVGATSDSYPYSYLDNNGHLTGFAVDLLDAVARAMNLHIRREIGTGAEINRRFAAGELDLNQFYAYLPSRIAFARFSAPFLFNNGAIFERRGDHRFPTIQELRAAHARIATAAGAYREFSRDYGFDPAQVHAAPVEEAIREVSDGRVDAALVARISGLAQIERLGIRNLVMVGPPVVRYPAHMSFAVRLDEEHLLNELNDGMAVVYQTGEFENIYRRWFSRYEPRTITREEFVAWVAAALALALIVALWALVHQRNLRRRIAQSNELLQAFHQNLPHAIGVVEREEIGWSIISLNPDGARLLGLAETPHLPCPFSHLGILPDIEREWEGMFAQGAGARTPIKIEKRSRDGRRDFVSTLVPLGGNALRARCCFLVEDVTDRRQNDAEIAQGRRLRALGELVGGIAHEFNNLLTPILIAAEELRAEWGSDRRLSERLALIADAARRSADLTRRLLAFGRLRGRDPELFDLRTLVQNTVALLRQTTDRRIDITYRPPPELPSLYLCSSDAHQILFNLLLNARDTLVEKLDHSPDPDWVARIRIETRHRPAGSVDSFRHPEGPRPGDWIEIEVRDSGMGMPPHVIERIFEPFYTTKEVGRGTGLGLATVWHLVTELGGRIEVESKPGDGSCFRFDLPVIAPPQGALKPEAPESRMEPVASLSSILVAEDEEDISRLLELDLQRRGHQVQTATNGLDAWTLLSRAPGNFDALVVDLNMAGLTGVELAGRARSIRPDIPILVMSGRITDKDLADLAALGVESILTKPFTLDEFRAALSGLASTPPASKPRAREGA